MRIALFVHVFFPNHFYGTETYTLELATELRELGHDVTVVTATPAGENAQTETIVRYRYAEIAVISIDKNRYASKRARDTYIQAEMRDVLDDILAELRPDLVHVTHLLNHTSTLLDVIRLRNIPCVATLTDFYGFCFTNKLEAADGSLCSGPNRTRSNCLACYFKGASEHASDSRLIQWAVRPPLRTLRIEAIRLGSLVPPLRNSWARQLVDDLAGRPEILRKLYENYSALISPTRFLQIAYERNGFDRPMHVIWFGTDIDRAPKPQRPGKAPLRIGFIGQVAPHKGIDLLVEAFIRLTPSLAVLCIYGPEEIHSSYSQGLRDRASGFDVEFLGTFPNQEIKAVLDALDIVVIPSRWYENSPLVLLNALAAHTPVVVSDVPGLTEFLQPEINGIAFERSSINSLEAALRRFVGGDLDARAMSLTTAYDRTTAMMAADVQAVYDDVLQRSR